MPESVQSIVLTSFKASGTKDGNVWGRLFGFVRSVWSQRVGLDNQAFGTLRSLPEESQMTIMMCHNGEQESASYVASQIQSFAAEADDDEQRYQQHAASTSAYPESSLSAGEQDAVMSSLFGVALNLPAMQ